MKRARPNHIIRHLLLISILLVVASLVVVAQQSRRVRAARTNTSVKRSVTSTGFRTAPHVKIGTSPTLPPGTARVYLNNTIAGKLGGKTVRGRVAGDANVTRQTILLSKATPAAGFSLQPPTSRSLHPYWSQDESYIYFDSDRVSDLNSAERTDGVFNIFRMVPDGSAVQQITTGNDQKIEPNVSQTNNLVAYVSGGTISFPGGITAPPVTNGFTLFFIDLNNPGAAPRQLTNLNAQFTFLDVRHPSFGPGGASIAFAGKITTDPTHYHIFSVNVASGNITQYTTGNTNDYSPAWSPTVNSPQGRSVIAFTSNADSNQINRALPAPVTLTPSAAGNDDIFVLDPLSIHPGIKRVTNFQPSAGQIASNRNPAWSTTRVDPRQDGVPQGTDANGNPTGQGRILLAFASTRTVDVNGQQVGLSPNGSTDIYFTDAPIGPDPQDPTIVTVVTTETYANPARGLTPTYPTPNPNTHHLQTVQPQYVADSIDKPGVPIDQFDAGFTSTEDFPTFPQFLNTYRIAFQSDKNLGGLNPTINLWASSILDLEAPTLLKYDIGSNQIVRVEDATTGADLPNRYITAGSRVRFKVRAVDYQSGIKYAYLQIKCPDSAPQSSSSPPAEHKIYYVGEGIIAPNFHVIGAPYEWDCQAVKTSDPSGQAIFRKPGPANQPVVTQNNGPVPANWPGFNVYTPGIDDFFAFSGSAHPPDDAAFPVDPTIFKDKDNGYWLPLHDDGTNTGLYVGEWTTPANFPSDWYIDVILYDNAVYPFAQNVVTNPNTPPVVPPSSNWKIYDNVWGFTTRQFGTTTNGSSLSQCLYVCDYDEGQKFLSTRFGNADFGNLPTNLVGLSFEGNPTESWTTEFDSALIPSTAIQNTTAYQVFQSPYLTPLGQNSYADALTSDGSNYPVTGHYDIWRIQCRGPIPVDVLNLYGPRTVTQPPDILSGSTTPRTVKVADRCIIWHTPYTGDLFVGPGTILDVSTQQNLTNFVNNGGRLFVNGQDIGFGLSLGQTSTVTGTTPPPVVSDFLNNTLKVFYLAEQTVTSFTNDKIDAPTDSFTGTNGRGVHPITFETWYSFPGVNLLHFYPGPNLPQNDPPEFTPPMFFGETVHSSPIDHLYSCPNAGAELNNAPIGYLNKFAFFPPSATIPTGTLTRTPVIGTIFPSLYGIDAYFEPTSAGPAMTWYSNPTTGGKVVFSAIGLESICVDQYIPPNTQNRVGLKPKAAQLTHNILDYLRTGRMVGTLRIKNASGSATTPIANAFVRVTQADPVTGIVATRGTARTGSDGSYVIEGLDATGNYTIDAASPGFVTQHAIANLFHGGYQSRTDFYLIQAQPVPVTGTITSQATGKPVPGITVQAVDTSDPTVTNPTPITSLPTGSDGVYTLPLPPSSYHITVVQDQSFKNGGFAGSVPAARDLAATDFTGKTSITGQDFALTQPPGNISGLVFVAGTNPPKPIPGATVTITVGSNTVTAVAGADGTYNTANASTKPSPGVPPGNASLVASASGFSPNSPPVTTNVAQGQTTPNVNIGLTPLPPGSLSGLVTTSPPLSQPVGGATVTLVDSAGNTQTTTTGPVQTETLPNGTSYQYNYKFTAVPAGASVSVTATKPGYTPKPDPDTQSASVTTGVETTGINFLLDPLYIFTSDLTLVSSPYVYTSTTIDQLFSVPGADINNTFLFVTWDATAQKYVYYPTPPANTFTLGQGYFLADTNTSTTLALTNPNFQTAPKDTSGNYSPFSIKLLTGWNLIGMPFTTSVDFSKLQIQDTDGSIKDVPTAQAGSNPAIGGALYTYASGAYEIVYTMDPFRGYWIRAFRPVTLIVTPGAQQNRSVGLLASRGVTGTTQATTTAITPGHTKGALEVSAVGGQGWKLMLKAEINDGGVTRASKAYLGTATEASDTYDQYKLQAPPAATKTNVAVTFDHNDWGSKSASYSMDVRSPSASSWDFTVSSNAVGAPVRVTWPQIATLPRRYEAIVTDLATQETFMMRNRSSVTIPASQAPITRHYRVSVQRATRNPMQIPSLTVLQTGTGRAGGTGGRVAITYEITKAAAIQIRILRAGRQVRQLTSGTTRDAGINQASWDLKTDQGASVPGDVYTVEVQAQDTEGRVARQLQTIVVTR